MDFESLFTQICHDLGKAGDVKEISTRFSTCSTDAQRISFVLALDSVRARFQEPLSLAKREISTSGKSQQLSTSHRVEGNNYYQKKLNWKAISSYNRSLLVGEGEALALAYANRSAVFHDTSDWLHSLRDIQLAFDHGYPKHLEHKLRERQGNCWLELGHVRQAFISFNLARHLLVTTTNAQSHKDKLVSIESKIVKLGDANPTIGVSESESNEAAAAAASSIERQVIKKRRTAPDLNRDSNALLPAASTSIELTDSDDRGRCLVATEDIQIGTTVIVEKALASILLEEFKESHCHHCLHWTPGPVPCHQCSQVGFCSTLCRDEAWASYHQSECGLTNSLHRTNVGRHGLLAVRTVLKVGRQRIMDANEDDECHSAGGEVCYDSTDYGRTIHRLVGNTQQRSVADLFRRAVMAVYLTSLIQLQRDGKEGDDPDEIVAAAVLQLVQSYPCNAHEISHLAVPLPGTPSGPDLPSTLQQIKLCEIGAAAMPVLSLINHSCDPNVVRICYGDVIVVRAIRRIARGDELLDNYGYHYATHDKKERQLKLSQQYYFRCNCRSCVQDWPRYEDAPNLVDRPELYQPIQRNIGEYTSLSSGSCYPDGPGHLDESARLFIGYLEAMDSDASIHLPVQEYSMAQEVLKHCWALSATLSPHLAVVV